MRRIIIALMLAGCDAPAPPPSPLVLNGSLPPRPLEASCRFEGHPPGVLPELAVSELAVSGVDLTAAVGMVPAPDDSGDVLVVESSGRVSRFAGPDATLEGTTVLSALEGETLAIDTSPHHPGKIFLARRLDDRLRISRFDDAAAIDPSSERVVLESLTGHGAALGFDDAGRLFLAIGDSATTPEPPTDADDASTPEGTILRVDVSNLDANGTFAVPPDNPTGKQLGLPDAEPVATFATGLREPRGCAFGQDLLWCVDQGMSVGEVHYVKATRDLGWPKYDGIECVEQGLCTLELERLPQAVVPRADPGCGMVGAAQIYAGARFPSLGSVLFYGDGCEEAIHGMLLAAPDGNLLSGPLLPVEGITGLGRDAQGEIFVLAGDRVLRVEAKNEGRPFPTKLSESACFEADGEPRPGVLPYEVNAALWTDGSHKTRFLELPPGSQITVNDDGTLRFPTGSVVIKRFAHTLAGAAAPVPVETRVMVRRQHGWEMHSYRWDDDGQDATLLDDADSRILTLADGSSLRHDFPDRYVCRVCHGSNEPELLGPRIDQLNRVVRYHDGHAQQLDAMAAVDLFAEPVSAATAPRMADPFDPEQPIEARARAYLHTNCGHCHQPGGWVSLGLDMDLRYETPLAEASLCGEPTQSGSAGIRLAPGDPDGSRLIERMSVRDFSQMPPLATGRVDGAGIDVVRAWIAAMTGCP